MSNRQWKRSHITQLAVLEAYDRNSKIRSAAQYVGVTADLVRVLGAPENVVWSAMVRESDRGFVECGTSLRSGWLTPEGLKRLAELRMTA